MYLSIIHPRIHLSTHPSCMHASIYPSIQPCSYSSTCLSIHSSLHHPSIGLWNKLYIIPENSVLSKSQLTIWCQYLSMYANGHTFVHVSHTKKACHSLSVCVWGVCALCSGTYTCVHIWRLEEDNGYPVISPLVLFLGWDLLLNLELACQPISPPCSSCFCLPKHQDCKHTWPHLTAYIGAGNLNSSPHGSASTLAHRAFSPAP